MSIENLNLTPEQRREIYLEEKSRIEGISVELTHEQVTKVYEAEKARLDRLKTSPAPAPSGDASGVGGVFAFLVIAAIVIAILVYTGAITISSTHAGEDLENVSGETQTSEVHEFVDYSDELAALPALN